MRLEELNASPISEIAVTNQDDCPFPMDPEMYVIYSTQNRPEKCRKCIQSNCEVTEIFYKPEIHRIRYLTSQCLKTKQYQNRIMASGLIGKELRETFQSAQIDKYNRKLYEFLKTWNTVKPAGIYILGDRNNDNPGGNGTGKSYALHALTHHLASIGKQPLYQQTTDLLNQIKSTYQDTRLTEESVLSKYKFAEALLWDDFGKERFKDPEWAGEYFYKIIDYRVRAELPLVIASNFTLGEIEQRFGENHGPAIYSRLYRHCEQWVLGGPDRRVV